MEFYTKVQCTVTASELPTDHDNSGVFSSTVHYGQGVFYDAQRLKVEPVEDYWEAVKKNLQRNWQVKAIIC